MQSLLMQAACMKYKVRRACIVLHDASCMLHAHPSYLVDHDRLDNEVVDGLVAHHARRKVGRGIVQNARGPLACQVH